MIRTNFFFAVALCLIFTSCDEVENPFEENGIVDPEPTGETRRVLVMDFTGHRCQACPSAALEANSLASENPGQVIALAVHPDIPSLTDPSASAQQPGDAYYTEWRTPEGSYFQSIYDIPAALPIGVISGVEVNSNYWAQLSSWRSIVEPLLLEERIVEVDFELDYNEINREILVNGNVSFSSSKDGVFSIILAVVENNIIDWQKNGSIAPADPAYPLGDVPDYVHKHVLRKHLNGTGGTELNTEPINAGDTFEFSESGTIDEEFVAEEVSIYAFVYDIETLEILDVIEKHIIE